MLYKSQESEKNKSVNSEEHWKFRETSSWNPSGHIHSLHHSLLLFAPTFHLWGDPRKVQVCPFISATDAYLPKS